MSRESDVKALKQLKNDMLDAAGYAKLSKQESDRGHEYRREIESAKFVFKPLPTHQEEVVRNGFVQGWKEKYGNPVKQKRSFLIVYSIVVLALSAFLLVDLFGQLGFVFRETEAFFADESSIEWLLLLVGTVAFFGTTAFLPWGLKEKKSEDDKIIFRYAAIGFGVGGFLFGYVAFYTKGLFVLVAYPVFLVVGLVTCLIIHGVCVSKSKHPKFTAEQKEALDAGRRHDEENAMANAVNEVKEKEKWDAWWAVRHEELKEKMIYHWEQSDIAAEKAETYLEKVRSSDTLGAGEKNVETVDWLLHFIQSRRADSIKEALHELDKMQQNEKILEIEREKYELAVQKARQEEAARREQLAMERRHQMEMEAQARRNADIQSQIAANTAAMRDSADRMRRDAASRAYASAETQARIASELSAIRLQDYYNS